MLIKDLKRDPIEPFFDFSESDFPSRGGGGGGGGGIEPAGLGLPLGTLPLFGIGGGGGGGSLTGGFPPLGGVELFG